MPRTPGRGKGLEIFWSVSIASGVACCQHGWWQDWKELDLPGYDADNEQFANPSLFIGSDLADPISGLLHRSFLCRVRPAQ
ncbi:MAG TPA: hypothetical protein VMT22_03020 [Terriglobales bacterium]|jgi:hypothetical protein|nr:hypothetical protein [Terriglobales bacterium]